MPARKKPTSPPLPVRHQVSSGGVAFRRNESAVEIAIIRPRGTDRWQLPKGLVDPGEDPDQTAHREVREEAGVNGDVLGPIETIEYWYVGVERGGERVRFHKTVHFFLIDFRDGDVANHDHEVAEARWMTIDEALERLAFRNEKLVVAKAREMILSA